MSVILIGVLWLNEVNENAFLLASICCGFVEKPAVSFLSCIKMYGKITDTIVTIRPSNNSFVITYVILMPSLRSVARLVTA